MNTQQPIYLFSGGRGRTILTTFSHVRAVIKSIGKKSPVVAYVGVASLKDNRLIYSLISAFIKIGCNCRIRHASIAPPGADIKIAKQILQDADAVFISGGDVEEGMQSLKDKKMVGFFQELARQGKLFVGVSAGSIMMCKEWIHWRDPEDNSSGELVPCLGLVPIVCDTHAEKDDWVELKTVLQLEGDGSIGYGIASGAYLKVNTDGTLSPLVGDVVRYVYQNNTLTRQSE